MKILHLITGLDGGGAEQTLLKICKLSNSLENNHLVISLQDGGVLLDDFKKNNIEVHSFNFKKNIFDIFRFIKLFFFVKKYQPNTVMTWLYHADFIGLLMKLYFKNSIKLIWNIRCSDINFNNYSIITSLLFNILKRYSYIPNLITFNSYSGKEFHLSKGYFNNNIKIIPNFIDTSYWKFNDEDRKKIRKKLLIDDKIFLIGNFGRFDPQKDHYTFINSAKILIKNNLNVKFLLIGKNTNNIYIDKNIRDYFIILEHKKNIKQYYSAIDMLVLSSSYGEGFSNVILESISMSIPCIVSDVGDNKRILDHNKDFIFEKGDFYKLTNLINNFIKLDKNFKNKQIRVNKKNIIENYDTKNNLKKFTNLWD